MLMVKCFFFHTVLFGLLLTGPKIHAQTPYPFSPKLDRSQGSVSSLPPSNSVSHIAVRDSSILWIGSSKGLARTFSGGRSWEAFRSNPAFGSNGIFAVAVRGDTAWASTGFTQEIEDDRVQTGSGYAFSLDNGVIWTHRPQTLDAANDSILQYGANRIRIVPIVVEEQNVTFDIDLSDSLVWIASWASSLRKSSDLGQTWQRVVLPNDLRSSISPNDTLDGYIVDPRQNNNFLAFSVFVQNDSTIWAGSAGGINKSTDRGVSWTRFTTTNQAAPILGNWVIAISGQQIDTSYRLWVTNWVAGENEQFGVSYTDDGGRIWKNFLHGIRAYAFAFKGSIAYVATEEGVYRTSDAGRSWTRSGTIVDQNSGEQVTSLAVFAVGVIGDTVYCATGDGIAKTIDNAANPFGQTWEVIRTYQPLPSPASTYAYPNPFSPDDEIVRIHYSTGGVPASVTIEILDFGMNRVRTVVKDAPRSGPGERDEIWDGRDDSNTQVANGVYFYRVVINDGEPVWGKVMVLQ